jgi:hypothetical protein
MSVNNNPNYNEMNKALIPFVLGPGMIALGGIEACNSGSIVGPVLITAGVALHTLGSKDYDVPKMNMAKAIMLTGACISLATGDKVYLAIIAAGIFTTLCGLTFAPKNINCFRNC